VSATAVGELRILFEKDHGTGGEHAYSRTGLWLPAMEAEPVVVASITYSYVEENATANLEVLRATSAGAVSPILDIDLSPGAGFLQVLGSGSVLRGGYVSDITIFYAVGVAALTAFPTPTLTAVTFGAAGTVGAAPTTAAFVLTPAAALQVGTSTAGQFYTTKLTTPAAPASAVQADLQKLTLRISPTMANTGTFDFAGALVHFAIA